MAKRRAVATTDTGVITVGQASIITELKFANDNLRWRLQQKQHLVSAQKMIIGNLQSQLSECQEKLKAQKE